MVGLTDFPFKPGKLVMTMALVFSPVAFQQAWAAEDDDPASQGANAPNQALPQTLMVYGEPINLPQPYAGGQVATGSRVGILGNKNFMDTPFNTTAYTAEYMENIQARTIQDVLKTDPTIRFQYNPGAMVESMYIRGSTYNINNSSLNGMMGMAPAFSVATEMLERVEVLRGPSAFLNGLNVGSEPNGGLNMVTKRALPKDLTRVSVDYASDANVGTHLDFSRRFGAEKQWGVRFNGVLRGGDTSINDQNLDRQLGSLALDYTTDRWQVNLDTYYVKDKFDGAGTFLVQAVNRAADNIIVPSKAPKYENGIKSLYGEEESQGIMLQGKFNINEHLEAYAGIGYAETKATGFYGGGTLLNPNAAGVGTLSLSQSNAELQKTAYETGLRGRVETGPIKHRMVLGWSMLELTQNQFNGTLPGSSVNIPGVNMYNPVFDTSRVPKVRPHAPKLQEQELSSIVLADTLDYEGLIQFTAGVRRQNVVVDTFNQTTGKRATRYDESATSPMFGLVLKPFGEQLAFYANYIEGLQRGPTAPNNPLYVNAGEVFAPYKSKQYEFGVKWDTGTFSNTLSFYQIDKPSFIARSVGNNKLLYTADGEQRNRGVEWMTFGEVMEGTRLLGGLAYTKTKLVKTSNGVNQGNEAGGYPNWQGNLGLEWDTIWDRNLTLIGRTIFNGSAYANSTNTAKLPGWATFDLGARYKAEVWGRQIVIRGMVENVFNRDEFWAGARTDGVFYVMPGRVFKLSTSIDF